MASPADPALISTPHPPAPAPDFAELVRVSARIGCLSFGGPAGQIALMHREIVEQRRWISEDQYLHALNLCHLLPGPEAQQLAVWIGWKLHGVRGGLAAGLLFVLPGSLVILGLSLLYVSAAGLGWFAALFLGIKAAVLAVVLQALRRVAGRALDTRFKQVIALAALVALAVFALPFPLVVLSAGVAGAVAAALRPDLLALRLRPAATPLPEHRPWGATLRAVGIGAIAWGTPLVVVLTALGPDHVLSRIGLFFARLAVVTFGGAYAVLAYMAQQAVTHYGWLAPREMVDGLGLAETTPGPLIMVTQFVGFVAAWRMPAPFTPLVAGLLGAGLTTWVTFAPCFLWIFALAPWMERLEQAQRLKGALAAITAAVVGVIANLSLWFALNVLFTRNAVVRVAGVTFALPDPASLDWRASLLALVAAGLIFGARLNVIGVLAACALGGLALAQVG